MFPLIGWIKPVCLSVGYIGPKFENREAYRKTKIGAGVAHVTRIKVWVAVRVTLVCNRLHIWTDTFR